MLDALVEKTVERRNGGRRSGSTKMGITHRTAGDFWFPGSLRMLGCRICASSSPRHICMAFVGQGLHSDTAG